MEDPLKLWFIKALEVMGTLPTSWEDPHPDVHDCSLTKCSLPLVSLSQF